ncbi:NAD(P)-dependent oxidoreductase [Porphyromonas gingivalis]|uniref:NAD-dependent epimerase/dehydratase family protein n=1 Tax=Porphyromonas gingivalis TaxID=837 RepID=UPI000974F5EF|nr:NAD(P)-dependent oxidoreductase [Porphyromonas gingivalis]MCE8193941.1 NAD(P)-dependent oxidoreductase [Porphyromonas gingivalis]MDP0530420.1 NAD(P)-dependent oxidoreductase [Porphyromonas gingivalis]MDP0623902.1 NAD(P)-dependent oxidoreductase [Porphyromonas gingivalis]WKD52555.1 NAD(P)-dependent oxidoreductase [Porphyromonas gingivalis]WKD54605.1 NAD(P)-dependent oxidoreductase [Porphyromonas gingivalis]
MGNKRVLITGATGFIGGYLVDEALRRQYEVWAAVRPHSDRSRLTDSRIRFVEIDYRDPSDIARLADKIAPEGESAWHLVIHNAGITKARDTSLFREINAEQTKRFLIGLQGAKHCPERFVLMSSMGSYGAPPDDCQPLSSSSVPKPTTAYGESKLLAEQYVQTFVTIPYTIIQPTGVYGPHDQDYLMAIRSVDKGFDFSTGNTPQTLTFIYAEDLASAVFIAAEHPDAAGQKYIVSDGKEYTDIEFGRMIQHLLGRKNVCHLRIPLPLVKAACYIGQKWADISGTLTPLNLDKYAIIAQRNWRCDSSPIRAIGFSPRYNLEQGLAETIRWARTTGQIRR